MYGRCSSLELAVDAPLAGQGSRGATAETTASMRDDREDPCGHVIFTTSGLISVTTPDGSWVLPPQRVLWVPSGVEYDASSRTSGAVRSLALAGDDAAGLPATTRLFEASSLMRELLIEGE